ncbi:DotH/IcmK family type IV secretion protein [Ensifer aridi]|uniref:DotH/IcmK family type IV secretion protein n=1 Tax=Ensifer aridi TaxID=1708715 RepID=UPI001AECFFD7|nr:DotH/IcmK family type IV secretion protein [Ensifer aridi]
MRTLAVNFAFLLALSGSAMAQQAAQPAPAYAPPRPDTSAELPEQPAQQPPEALESQQPAMQGQPAPSKFGEADPNQAEERQPRLAPNVPIIGARRLLQSLSELDRPLTPEEITAYGATVQSVMPMSPELIREYRKRIDDSQKAAAMPPNGVRATPISDSLRMSLKSNQPLQTLYTTPNTVSVMAFYDRTGKAWPIASYVVGRADSFQVYALQEGSNQLAVTPLVSHGYSNLIISLVEEDRPIVINLETNDSRTHFRRDITVEAYGPNAEISPTTVATKTPPSDKIMMSFAQGADLPDGAVSLRSSDPEVEAWTYKGDLYIRTANTLISPSWNSALTGPGAVHAYRLKPTPVALVSRKGTISRVRISQ